MIRLFHLSFPLLLSLLAACSLQAVTPSSPTAPAKIAAETLGDPHSYAEPEAFRTRHLSLDLRVDFQRRVLSGTAELQLQRMDAKAGTLVLDTRDLEIAAVEAGTANALRATTFAMGPRDAVLGRPLRIAMPAGADRVRIRYATRPEASGLQWLNAAQTADRKLPFLFTQSQAIHARSWIPLQDTPQLRITYDARIRTPKNLMAVMSAENDLQARRTGDYRFRMPQPVPSYLLALAVGDLQFRALGPRTGIYAERSVLAAAAAEFSDTEKMLARSEALYGPYRWGRYDLLILPPSFPYGGMENPRLTFASPSVIAGDKSLVSLVAHELAHSWSGNLVTNAVWRDFWLNEGFTNHLSFRIMEELYGRDRAQQERTLAANDLKDTLAVLTRDDDKTLAPDLNGRDPSDYVTDVPYERGALFLAYLEQKYGRTRFDAFLRGWFDRHAFTAVRSGDFVAYLDRELLSKYPGVVSLAKVNEWLYQPRMPADTPWPVSDAFKRVERARDAWLAGKLAADRMGTASWSPAQWRYFLDTLPVTLSLDQLTDLDEGFGLTHTGNAVVAARWLRLALANDYPPVYPAVDAFLNRHGRMLLIAPIYEQLARSEDGLDFAREIYDVARAGYHPIAREAVEKILATPVVDRSGTPAVEAEPATAPKRRPADIAKSLRPARHPFQRADGVGTGD